MRIRLNQPVTLSPVCLVIGSSTWFIGKLHAAQTTLLGVVGQAAYTICKGVKNFVRGDTLASPSGA